MIVDCPTPRSPAPASGGDEGCWRRAVVASGVGATEADPRVCGCVAAPRSRTSAEGGRFSAVPTFPPAAVRRTYSPIRVPYERSYPAPRVAGGLQLLGRTKRVGPGGHRFGFRKRISRANPDQRGGIYHRCSGWESCARSALGVAKLFLWTGISCEGYWAASNGHCVSNGG